MVMFPMKLTIFVLVSLERVDLSLSRPFQKLLILDLHEYLGNGGVERWQQHLSLARSGTRTSIFNLSSRIPLMPPMLHVALIVHSS